MGYEDFLKRKIEEQRDENINFPRKVWKYISEGNKYYKSNYCSLHYYESIDKKLISGSNNRGISKQEFATQLLKLDGLGLEQTLELWAVKPETQNKNESWKKEYLETYSNGKISVDILDKIGPNSIYLNDKYELTHKPQSKTTTEKSESMKTFDFIIKCVKYQTSGFDGCLVVDKTTKVQGGSQRNTQGEIMMTIKHLASDQHKRNFIILLDGGFWDKFRLENKNKYENVIVISSDELINLV